MGYRDEDEEVEIDVGVRHETDKAYLVYDGKREVWIPKSQIVDKLVQKGKIVQITLPEWLAKDKGLI